MNESEDDRWRREPLAGAAARLSGSRGWSFPQTPARTLESGQHSVGDSVARLVLARPEESFPNDLAADRDPELGSAGDVAKTRLCESPAPHELP